MVDGLNGAHSVIVVLPARKAHKHEVENAIPRNHLGEAHLVMGISRKSKIVRGIHVLVFRYNSNLSSCASDQYR